MDDSFTRASNPMSPTSSAILSGEIIAASNLTSARSNSSETVHDATPFTPARWLSIVFTHAPQVMPLIARLTEELAAFAGCPDFDSMAACCHSQAAQSPSNRRRLRGSLFGTARRPADQAHATGNSSVLRETASPRPRFESNSNSISA
jgi:hypothetical protein